MKTVLDTLSSRGGTNSSMFANCSVFCDVREVRSSVLAKKGMFGEVRCSVLMFGELPEHLEGVKRPTFCQKN